MTGTACAVDEVEVLRDCSIPVGTDGAELAADVYKRRGAPPGPALVTLLPYHKDGLAGILGSQAYRYFAARGYACVLVDLRGLGGSSGQARPPFDPGEAADGAAAIGWAAAQPWCDGAVGMWGASYGALTALRTAVQRPAGLKAIVAVVGTANPERDFIHPDGLRGCMSSLGVWGLLTLAQHLWPPLHQDVDGRWLERWWRRLETAEPWVIDLARHGPGDPSWQSRAVDVSLIAVPTFCVGGWRDLFCEGTLRTYEELRGPKKLLMGPWMHTLPDESQFAPVDFLSMATRWWDRWLRDEPNGIDEEEPVTFYLQRRGTWHRADRWPPPDSTTIAYRPQVDGGLSSNSDGGEVRRAVDVTAGVGGGLWGMPTRGIGPPDDQHDDDVRSIAFTSEPLESSLEITGRPRVTLGLADDSSRSRTLVVKLAEVDGAGRSTLITAGAIALPDSGVGDDPIDVELYGTSFEVPAGHRVRLVVAGADFPRLWPDQRAGQLALRCADTSLELPAVHRVREPVSLPTPDAPIQSRLLVRADPIYTVVRDRTSGAVRVDVGEQLIANTPDGLGRLELSQVVSAGVRPRRSDTAHLTGRSTTTFQGPAGEIVVTAEILLSGAVAVASGTVTWDGHEIFSRRWAT